MTAPLSFVGAGVRVDVTGLTDEVAELVLDVGAGMAVAPGAAQGEAARTLEVRRENDEVVVDGWRAPSGASAERIAAAVLAAVDRACLAATRTLVVHAAAFAGPGGAAVVPAASGAGKSTLSAAAMQAGLVLLSDEAACVRPEDGRVIPHARPLGLSATSRRLLGLDPGADWSRLARHAERVSPDVTSRGHEEEVEDGGDELAVAPALLGSCADGAHAVRIVALPHRVAGRPVSVDALPRPDGVVALLAACLNTGEPDGAWARRDAWLLLTEVVRSALVVRLEYDRPAEAAEALRDLLA